MKTVQLRPTVKDSEGQTVSGAGVTWQSNNSAVASVSATGLVTARGNGSATITATSGGKTVTATITVSQVPATIAVTPDSATLRSIGETIQLTATVRDTNNSPITGARVSWSSNYSGVVNVSSSGLVTARGNGSATITATLGGKTAIAAVTVSQAPATIVVTPDSAMLRRVNETIQLTAVVRDANHSPITGATVRWSSNNSAVASVSATGLVTARGNGICDDNSEIGR